MASSPGPRCPACGLENRDDAGFCGGCGAILARERVCPRGSRASPPGRKCCDGCGQPFAAGPRPFPDREPRAYTPAHLARKILDARSDVEGRARAVTLLLAELKGGMELAWRVDPDEWRAILDGFFEILAKEVHRFEGTVSRTTGDALVAIFGAPLPHQDHARRACYAGLHVAAELRGFADQHRRSRGVDLPVGLALHSGEISVGKIGDDLRMEFTVQGDELALGSRVVQLAEAGRVYATRRTVTAVEGAFRFGDLGAFDLGEGGEPTALFELQGVSPMRTRVNLARSRGSPRVIERRRVGLLSADVVGYSRLMADDEVATVETLTAYREVMTELIERHRGRVVDFTGDNLLAEFPAAEEAVRSASSIQRELRDRNAELALSRRMQLRVGVHLADVMVDEERLYGDGVNIAARLEGLAEPGGICISGEVFDRVGEELTPGYQSLGEQQLKNIPNPVRIYRQPKA